MDYGTTIMYEAGEQVITSCRQMTKTNLTPMKRYLIDCSQTTKSIFQDQSNPGNGRTGRHHEEVNLNESDSVTHLLLSCLYAVSGLKLLWSGQFTMCYEIQMGLACLYIDYLLSMYHLIAAYATFPNDNLFFSHVQQKMTTCLLYVYIFVILNLSTSSV